MQTIPQPFPLFESGLAEELGVLPMIAGETEAGPGSPGAAGLLCNIVNAGAPGGHLQIHKVNACD